MGKTRLKGMLAAVAVAATFGWSGVAQGQGAMQSFTPLPAPNCGTVTTFLPTNNCIQFGDFSVYSLNFLYSLAAYSGTGVWPTTNSNPGDPYHVLSNPGELGSNGYIVYGTGTNNNNTVTNGAGTLIDDAQQHPSGTGSTDRFAVGAGSETAPTFARDDPALWSGQLGAIRTELAAGSSPSGQFVLYFNLNETGTENLLGIDLLVWAAVTLRDSTGTLADKTFYLTGNPGSTVAPDPAAAVGGTIQDEWVYVHGTICASPAGFLGFGSCTAAQTAAGGRDVNQNLGANQAAFAIYNQELSDAVLNAGSGYDSIQGNWRFAFINNGYEQIFSALTPVGRPPVRVPEPSTLGTLGLGLLGLAFLMRRRAR